MSLRLASMGKLPEGARLQRIQQSPNYRNGAFQNQEHTAMKLSGSMLADVLWQKMRLKEASPTRPFPHLKTDLHRLEDSSPVIIWFGHSSYYISYKGLHILVDPVFSGVAAPVRFLSKAFVGTDIYRAEDIPPVDIIIQTHDHYDHLDRQSMTYFKNKVGHFVAPLGVGAHLEYWGVPAANITELDWLEACEPLPGVKLQAMPARHFSGRGLKRNQTLWASFILQLDNYKLYLGGDSGYGPHFKAIGNQHGPFDIALLECGQYSVHWHEIHMLPEETAQACIDLQAKVLMPVHWARFSLSLHNWHEPIERLSIAAEKRNLHLTTPMIGQPVTLGSVYPHARWWLQR